LRTRRQEKRSARPDRNAERRPRPAPAAVVDRHARGAVRERAFARAAFWL